MLCQLRWMKDLEELLKTVEVYFSIYFTSGHQHYI